MLKITNQKKNQVNKKHATAYNHHLSHVFDAMLQIVL